MASCYSYFVPYREVPQAAVTPLPDDPASVSEVIALREGFARMDAAKLWPPPADPVFKANYTNVLATSGDGKQALICAVGFAWRIDLATMVASAPIELPADATIAALSQDGSIAAFIAKDTLYRWDLHKDASTIENIWSAPSLTGTNSLCMSADGTTLLVASRSQRATVRVFDLDARTMTFSLKVDADECLLLHPAGRHLIAFGDDAHARFYGESGHFHSIEKCAGGAFSPDGTKLLTNSHGNAKLVQVFPLNVEGSEMRLGLPQDVETCAAVKRWDFGAVFSPSGKRAILKPDSGKSIYLDLETGRSRRTCIEYNESTAFVADELMAISAGVSAHAFGLSCEAVAVIRLDPAEPLGVIAASRNKPPILSLVTPLGLYGSIESDPRFIKSTEQALPYERPPLMSPLLSGKAASLERMDQQHFDEMCFRRDIWQPFLQGLTVDIDIRQLMGVNCGLLELTPEIVHRARIAVSQTRRFGSPQISLAALQTVADELRALSLSARGQVFEGMVRRMRGTKSSSLSAPPQGKRVEPVDPSEILGTPLSTEQSPNEALATKAEEQSKIDDSDDYALFAAANRDKSHPTAPAWLHRALRHYLSWSLLAGAAAIYYLYFF